jgi:hypothetical protein
MQKPPLILHFYEGAPHLRAPTEEVLSSSMYLLERTIDI